LTSTNRKTQLTDAPKTVNKEPLKSTIESDVRSADRWHALDELLCESFGAVSPAYLFTGRFGPLVNVLPVALTAHEY
jgi:hypothetical protein